MKILFFVMMVFYSSITFSKIESPKIQVSNFSERCASLGGKNSAGEDKFSSLLKTRISSIEAYSVRINDDVYSRSLQLDFISEPDALSNKLYIPLMNNGQSESIMINLSLRAAEYTDTVSVCYNNTTNSIEAIKVE